MLQSGFPQQAVAWAMPYAALALAIDQPAPIHSHERDAAGNVLPEYEYKLQRTCWQEHRDGEDFKGVTAFFGQLCFYLDRTNHSCMPRTSPGLFVGWKLESGLRYRSIVQIADFDAVREGDFK